MLRTFILCLTFLAAAGAAAADEPAAARAAPAASVEQPAKPAHSKAKRNPRQEPTRTASADAPATSPAPAADGEIRPGADVKLSGMSVLGNEDSPKSLALVPWKSSQLGDMPSVSRLLDTSTQPVDKDVFMRELSYYDFRTGSK
jgi:hypothetical protein